MTETILSPNGVESYVVRVVVVPGLGAVAPVGALTPAEVQALRDDVATAMNQNLDDLANVTEAGKVEGMVLGVLADGSWSPQNLPGMIERVGTNWPVGGIKSVYDVNVLTVDKGIDIDTGLSIDGRAHLALVWGASGTTYAIARSDHSHPPTLVGRFSFNKAAAVLSGGTSELVNQAVTGMVATSTYDIDVIGRLEAVNTNSSGRIRLYTQIGAFSPQNTSHGFSGGVWTQITTDGTRMSVTGVTSLQVRLWAEYESGDPTALYDGFLKYVIHPRGGQ